MDIRVTTTCCVLLALCCLQTCLTDSSWDYSGVRSKAEAVALATGIIPSSTGASVVSPLTVPQAVKPLLQPTSARAAAHAANSTRGQGACGDAMFKNWAGAFNYTFSRRDRQEAQRRFCSNMEQVRKINVNASISYWASGNAFSHLSFEQFTRRYLANLTLGKRPAAQQQQHQAASKATPTRSRKLLQDNNPAGGVDAGAGGPDAPPLPPPPPLATSVNWVEQGKVTSIKTQGGCGSCWAFTAVSVIESMYLIASNASAADPTTPQPDLSEQQLVSCVNAAAGYVSNGCGGGSISEALDYVSLTALTEESLYPYVAVTGTCDQGLISRAAQGQAVVSSALHQDFPYNDETALIQAVQAAPTAVYFSVDASFFLYSGGVYSPDPSNTNSINHALVVVGFDTVTDSNRHWLVRNSWGEAWGERGYARVQMTGDSNNSEGPCGMYLYAYQPATGFSSAPLLLGAP